MSDDDNTALKGLEGLGQGAKGVSVEVVGGLVEDNQVRSLPRAGSKDDLDTLSTRQTTHARMGDQLGVEAEVGTVSLNLLSDQGSELTAGEGLLLINLSNHLLM